MTDRHDEQATSPAAMQVIRPSDNAVVNAPFAGDVINISMPMRPQGKLEQSWREARVGIGQLIREQLRVLTDRGTIEVPWQQRIDRPGAGLADRAADVAGLADHVIQGGQVVAFGDSRSGKTTLAARLAIAVADRSSNQLQPVLFTVSTWNPRRVALRPWLLRTIETAYDLSDNDLKAAAWALDAGLIIPIWDGFDEVAPSLRGEVGEAIWRLFGSGPLIITSIPVPPDTDALTARFPDAEVIHLEPVGTDEVVRYLTSADQAAAEAIRRVFGEDPKAPAALALSSPLNAWLAKTMYPVSRQAELIGLFDVSRFPTPESVEEHLFTELIGATFRRRGPRLRDSATPADRFLIDDARRWLAFLSQKARNRIIAFWEIRQYAPLTLLAWLAVTALCAATAALGSHLPTLPGAVFVMMLAGLTFAFGFSRGYAIGRARGPKDPTRIGFAPQQVHMDGDLRLQGLRFLNGLALMGWGYLVMIAILDIRSRRGGWLLEWNRSEAIAGAVTSLLIAPAAAFIGGRISAGVLRARPGFDAKTGARAADPLLAIKQDRRSGLGMLGLASLVFTLGYLLLLIFFLPWSAAWAFIAVPIAACVPMYFWNEWVCFRTAHIWLACQDKLPWQFGHFLRACHDGNILRKNGNHFEFRHQRLQASLARLRA